MAAQEPKTNTAPAQEKTVKPVAEKQTNCPVCNKPIKKLKRYYRNGIFYCNKRCWRKSKEPKEAKQ